MLGNLQGPDTSSQLPNLAPQTLRIAEEIDKHSSLECNLLCMMFHNLCAKVQKKSVNKTNMIHNRMSEWIIRKFLGLSFTFKAHARFTFNSIQQWAQMSIPLVSQRF